MKNQLLLEDWSVTVTTGGKLKAQTIALFSQSQDKYGLSPLSMPKIVTIANQGKIILTVNPSAIKDKKDVSHFKFFAKQKESDIYYIGQVDAKETDGKTYKQFPLIFELTHPVHLVNPLRIQQSGLRGSSITMLLLDYLKGIKGFN
jgi:hypothetical protein